MNTLSCSEDVRLKDPRESIKGPEYEIPLLSLSRQNQVHTLLFKDIVYTKKKKKKKRRYFRAFIKLLKKPTEAIVLRSVILRSSYLSMITGSDGVSFRFPQLFLSQHRLKYIKKKKELTHMGENPKMYMGLVLL